MCEHPSAYRETASVARKPHICIECRRQIAVGDLYQNVWGIWDGKLATYHTCGECWEIREDLWHDMLDAGVYYEDVYCGLAFGQLQETLTTEIREQAA